MFHFIFVVLISTKNLIWKKQMIFSVKLSLEGLNIYTVPLNRRPYIF